jgi:signal transduction histidine kinase
MVDYKKYITQIQETTAGEHTASILYLPLLHKDKLQGVITAQSFEKNAYSEYHLNILRNLATYVAIALDNAEAYRQLNSILEDLKATQEKLVTQEKLASLGALTAGIAHEIKNPMNFINNFAEIIVELVQELREYLEKYKEKLNSEDVEDIEEILINLNNNSKKIFEHGRRADGIVRGMLQHSRGKTGDRQETDLNDMLEEDLNLAYHGMRAQNSEFNITINKDLDDSLEKIQVVPQDISRVFLNIITNGFYEVHKKKMGNGDKFSPTISVSSKNFDTKVEICIRDNGNGIPKDIHDKLFVPFFSTKPTGQGTGLGLSLSYDIVVKEHHGEIKFETVEGEFTEFIIRLPKN